MGRHEFPGAVAAHDQDGAMREQARRLAGQMNTWLTGSQAQTSYVYNPLEDEELSSDLVEWCRSARDILAAVARG